MKCLSGQYAVQTFDQFAAVQRSNRFNNDCFQNNVIDVKLDIKEGLNKVE